MVTIRSWMHKKSHMILYDCTNKNLVMEMITMPSKRGKNGAFGHPNEFASLDYLIDKCTSLSKPKTHIPYQAHNNEQFLLLRRFVLAHS